MSCVRVGLFAIGTAIVGAVGLRMEGRCACEDCGSARGCDVCLQAILCVAA